MTPAKGATRVVQWASAALMVVALALALLVGARSAVATIGGGCIALAVARAVTPVGMLPGARSRLFDVALLLGFAFVLFLFLPYAGPGLERPVTVP